MSSNRWSALFALILLTLLFGVAKAAENDWAEGSQAASDGATRDYYNRGALLSWKHLMGDWRDARDVAQGDSAYAIADVIDNDSSRFVQWDLTSLVREWKDGKFRNQGLLLRTVNKGGNVLFNSREHSQVGLRPKLIVEAARGSASLEAAADTFLTKSTYRSQGRADTLRVSAAPDHSLLRFDLKPLAELGRVAKATLRLYTTRQYGSARVGVFRCAQGHDAPLTEPIKGVAQKYPDDEGIAEDPEVIFATNFESPHWNHQWTYAGKMDVIDTVAADAKRKFEPLVGKALRVRIAEGATGALNTLFKFEPEIGREPEQIYFRYYLRLGEDWNQTIQGGKLPGISGTYGVAGWGGRKSNGKDGWSARGLFRQTIPVGNPLAGRTPVGTYCYHADMEGNYGTNWIWQKGYRGYLRNNRWYAIEQYLKLNTPGKKDGVLRAWVDGRPAFAKSDIRFRHIDRLKIEQVWMNVYHGGTKPSPYDQHLFIDNVVIARKYIGPMKQAD